jgi:hypothetical protein
MNHYLSSVEITTSVLVILYLTVSAKRNCSLAIFTNYRAAGDWAFFVSSGNKEKKIQ